MPKRILVVDDERGIIEVLSVKLRASGYEVLVARDGATALEVVKSEKPDLVILDVMMPAITGTTLCGIMKYDEELKKIPVILVTVKDRDLDKTIGKTVKADAYITKPFNFKDVLEKVEQLLA